MLCFGSYIGKSIAVEISLSNQGNETNSKNVKFEVYLDENDRNVKEKTAKIESEMQLYISVAVQGKGYLKNPEIELVDTNFRLKNNSEVTKFKLDSVQSERGTTVALPIIAKKDESYNLSLLDMQSQIKLTGEYIDENGNVTDINTTKAIKASWTLDELTEENISLNQEVITNKIYNIDGINKRVIQVLITSKLKENVAPVKSSLIEVANPEVGMEPEEVKVAGYTTKATNGKTNLEFANGENSTWEYNSEEGKTFIQILNNANEENAVTWAKNAEDKFIVTYIYNESTKILPFVSNVKSTTEIYGRTKGAIEKTNTIKQEELAETGDIAKLENNITRNIYKGKMYIGEDTNYKETSNIYVPYSKIANSIVLKDSEEQLQEGISTYYKTTKINKAEALKLLGNEGTITVYNAENKTTPIKEIALSEETEDDYYTISYDNNVNKIEIEMSKAQTEGKIEITNEKAVKISNTAVAQSSAELKTNKTLTVTDANNNVVVNSNIESTAKLLEPKTTFNVSLDKTSISALSQNNVKITAELTSKDESNKLFINPTINIVLPKEIKEASIEHITPVVGDSKLSIKSYNLTTNEEGNQVIAIQLKGEQVAYSSNAATIVIDAKLKTDSFIANKNVEIKTTCINNAETVEKTNNINIVSKSGLVTKSTIKVGEKVAEKINQTTVNVNAKQNEKVEVSAQMINNYENALSNEAIVGTIPQEAILSSEIATNIKDAKVYYSEEENPQVDSDSWKTEAQNLESLKSFKIVPQNDIKQGETVTLNYKYELKTANAEESTIKVSGTVAKEEKQETLKFITNAEQSIAAEQNINGINIALEAKTMTNTIHQGQIITYNLKVKNTTGQALNNVTLDYIVPSDAILTELTEAQGTSMTYTDDENTKNKTWEIETIAPEETISKDVTIKVKEQATQIVNKVTLKNADKSEIASLTTEPVQVIDGDLTVSLSRRVNMGTPLSEGSEIEYVVMVQNNTGSDINNVELKSKVPNQTIWEDENEYNQDWEYNKETQELTYTIDNLQTGQTLEKRFVVSVDKVGKNISQTNIDNSAIAIYNKKEYASNVYTSTVLNPVWKIQMDSDSPETLNIGNEVKYVIKVTNETEYQHAVSVLDKIPDEIQVDGIRYYSTSHEDAEEIDVTNDIEVLYLVSGGETLTIEVTGTVLNWEEEIYSKQITNVAKIDLGDEDYLESNAITNTIINNEVDPQATDPSNPTDPTDPSNPTEPTDPTDPSNPTDPSDTPEEKESNSISGLAWLDENKDGIRDENEQILQAVKVILLDKEGKQIAESTTSLTGTYKFENIKKGEYTVVFEYDTSKYAVTKYQTSDATDETNSDAISKQIEINGETKTVGITDTITLQDEDINNIDIGLIQNAKFDLRLDKYISKVVLTNSAGTSTYEYEDTNFTKVEISAKKIEGTVMLVEYDLTVTNEGDVDGYVGDIIDYLPDGLVFTSEANKDWYMDGNKALHNKTLSEQVIKAGETKTVTLVLTKTLKSNSTGTIENIGEIGENTNLQGITEFDSVAGNKQLGEDDISTASLIVSIATGSPVMYIGIVVATMLVLGLGIYIINKKVLKERI